MPFTSSFYLNYNLITYATGSIHLKRPIPIPLALYMLSSPYLIHCSYNCLDALMLSLDAPCNLHAYTICLAVHHDKDMLPLNPLHTTIFTF
jgi:hypothetical protein